MKNIFFFLLCTLIFLSCKDNDQIVPVSEVSVRSLPIEKLVIPEGFDFSTSAEIEVQIVDAENNTLYQVFYEDQGEKVILGSVYKKTNSQISVSVKIPMFIQELQVSKDPFGKNIVQKGAVQRVFCRVEFKGAANRTEACYEKLYAVNSAGGFYSINNESSGFEETDLGPLSGGGSIACAVDKQNKLVYYNVGTTLWSYDIVSQTFSVVHTGNPFNGSYPRMEYNQTNGKLYIANNTKMYIIEPSDGTVLSNIDVVGLEAPTGGGDVAISLDGTIYMCCFSGLYRVEISGSVGTATRISGENLPFQPTSMAIDRNDNLFLGTNDANSQLIQMDKFDGAWSVMKTYSFKINDLSSLPCDESELSQIDTDGDGVIDQNDDFPDDAAKAFELFTPSKFGYGSLGFEDLWPQQGDYDFNDMALSYRYIKVNNSDNETVQLILKIKMLSVNAGYQSGFGVEFPFLSSRVVSVTGNKLQEGVVTTAANGTEQGHTKAVVIVFENGFNHGNYGECATQPDEEIEVVITFTEPLTEAEIGNAPFNPFMFNTNNRGREVHLINKPPTALGDLSLLGTEDDKSVGNNYYVNSNGLPWAIDIIHVLRVPKSGKPINTGYNNFNQWATSGGGEFSDWYKDNSGYRNTSNVCLD